jgi:hypothetical protein
VKKIRFNFFSNNTEAFLYEWEDCHFVFSS